MAEPVLNIRDLSVFYGQSHALQGVDLELERGVLSVVGRNGMGKTTLCKSIMGLQPAAAGTIDFAGRSLIGMTPPQIARLGIGYVPQGRRLWRSLTVDEHLRLVAQRGGAWTPERVYSVFPRLAERRGNGGAQLSGGEQQMLAIGRALLLNPKLLVMDEPTEGLAPVIVQQVQDMLVQLGREGDVHVLVIEQNIGVACSVSEQVAIMVNGRIDRVMDAASLAADRDLQQAMLGVGRHAHDEVSDAADNASTQTDVKSGQHQPTLIYNSNPKIPNRWSRPVPVRQIEGAARTLTIASGSAGVDATNTQRPASAARANTVYVAGTMDTKAAELRFMRDVLKKAGLQTAMIDLSTTGEPSGAEVPPHEVAACHPRGTSGVFTGDRGTAVAGMTLAFERWMQQQSDVAGVIGAGGSGGTALVAPAFRSLPVGVPKVIVSTIASGNTEQYVGPADILMLHSVADVQGINSITREVLGNGASALAGMVSARKAASAQGSVPHDDKPAIGLSMFGVTTPSVQQVTAELDAQYDCLVFHATGTGGRAMEKLLDDGLLQGVIDLTTTEVCDMVAGGVFAATEDRFGAVIRTGKPYIGSCGALDMVNFNAPDTVPAHYQGRLFYEHNPQITLMRTTVEENRRMGQWIGERLNQMTGPVRFFLPEGGVSMLDAPDMAFWDPEADAALFNALEETVRQTASRQLIRLPHNINDAEFAQAIIKTFRSLHGSPVRRVAGA
jgi:uncharacterized protein (UPF0261 family)/ABC-type branched-subunit amino acid transport system ATPase component